jgi:hypothetical protein
MAVDAMLELVHEVLGREGHAGRVLHLKRRGRDRRRESSRWRDRMTHATMQLRDVNQKLSTLHSTINRLYPRPYSVCPVGKALSPAPLRGRAKMLVVTRSAFVGSTRRLGRGTAGRCSGPAVTFRRQASTQESMVVFDRRES